MNILFLTMVSINSINERGIYTDLLRQFVKNKDNVFIVSPVERKYKQQTTFIKNDNITLLKVKTFNIQKTNIIEKGIGILAIEHQYLNVLEGIFRGMGTI